MKKSDKLYFYYQPWTRDEIIGDIRRLRDWIDYLPCEEAGTPGLMNVVPYIPAACATSGTAL